ELRARQPSRNADQTHGVDRKGQLIPPGIDRPPQNVQARRADFDLPEEAFVLVTAGRVVARKATTQLIETLAALPDVFLVVVGDGPEADAVRQKAAGLGVANRLRMLGYVSDEVKDGAYAVADVFVSNAQHEGFGLVFLR